LTDEGIMFFTDEDWNKIIVAAQGEKLAAQQKVIDADNAKKLLERTIVRENELIATGAVLYSDGMGKVYRKGSASVTAQTIKDCIDEGWPKIVDVFRNVIVTPPNPDVRKYPVTTSEASPVTLKIANEGEATSEISDEEKMFNFASVLDNVSVPVMKTDEGKTQMATAMDFLSNAIFTLRQ
jgi:hypothetical protein